MLGNPNDRPDLRKLELSRVGVSSCNSGTLALVQSHKPTILFLMEMRFNNSSFCSLKLRLGFCKGFMVHRIGYGGGLAILWRDDLAVNLIIFSMGHIDVWVEIWLDVFFSQASMVIGSFIYGSILGLFCTNLMNT